MGSRAQEKAPAPARPAKEPTGVVRFPIATLASADELAIAEGITRSEAIHRLVEKGLGA